MWKLDEFLDPEIPSLRGDKYFNDFFPETVLRDATGRFIVKIPFKKNYNQLGDSKEIAIKRFYSLERRLNTDKSLKSLYVNFINEYIKPNHMSELTNFNRNRFGYFLPHHPVMKESSNTTKLRAVFNESQKTDIGLGLNDVQIPGPSLQANIFAILLKFCKHTYIVTADIEKMFRQILIGSSDRNYQWIFWREQLPEELKMYDLNTVTYGTASASFLAVRCLQLLADENTLRYPIEAQIIK